MAYTNRTTAASLDASYIAGMKKHCTKSTVIFIDGESYTPAQLSTIFQAEMNRAAPWRPHAVPGERRSPTPRPRRPPRPP